ncbi:MAG: PAS domain S-box protein [Bacteroidetes bacterium]|nr:PAS domain S-box protein [Bacteroidota bacterium]
MQKENKNYDTPDLLNNNPKKNIDYLKLLEKEERYHQMFQFSPNSIIIHDFDMNILDANNKAVNELGYSKKELLEKKIYELNPNKELRNSSKVLAAMKGKKLLTVETTFMRKDGSVFLAESTPCKYMLRGKLIIHVVIRDITKRKKAEQDLKESENKYKRLVENSPFITYGYSKEGEFYASAKIYDILGIKPSEIKNNPSLWINLIVKEDFHKVKNVLENLKEGSSFNIEYRIKDRSGNLHWFRDCSTTCYKNENDIIVEGIAEDITNIKISEQKLKEIQKNLQDVVGNSPDGIIVADSNGQHKYVNKKLTDIINYSEAESLELTIKDITPADELEKYAKMDKSIIKGEKIPNLYQRTIIAKGGAQIPIEIRTTSTTWKGEKCGLIFITDITEREKAEKALKKAKEHAENCDRLKSAFLANMSHEIRTPMNGIIGFANLLKEPNLTGKQQQQYISIIEKSGDRMLNIINDIINISKIESGLMELSLKKSNINQQIEYIYTFFKPEIEAKGIKFSFKNHFAFSDSIIKTDREKLFAILTNLVKNAIKFTKNGSIEFGYTKSEKFLKFYVKDTGIGINGERQKAIFDRFVQADISDKQALQGAGLGLAISKAYAEMLGGKMWVESEEGNGSIFYFTIPYDVGLKKTDLLIDSNTNIDSGIKIKNLKILIAEDDEASYLLMNTILKKVCDDLLHAKTGVETIEFCRNNPDIDLVLMDIRMPDMDGYEATRQIRQFNKNIIIVAQTAYGLVGDKEKAIKSGCNEYLPKPIIKSKLFSLIKTYFIK